MVLPASVLGGVLAGVTYVAMVDPHQPGRYPVCPTFALAGFYCPGCGMLRATHDLATGDVAGSLARNPLAIPLYVAAIALFALWVLRRWQGRQLEWTPSRWLPAALAISFVVYTVARNIPGWTWLSPA
jgi:hypothetical protein